MLARRPTSRRASGRGGKYRRTFAVGGVRAMLSASMLARLPLGVDSVGLLLHVEHERGSFTTAGAVTGAFGLAVGLGAPLQGRLVDRLGPGRTLVPAALIHAVALLAVVALAAGTTPVAPLAALAAIAGAALPPVGSVQRTLWAPLLRRRRALLSTAHAIDSLQLDATMMVGPLLVALCAAAGQVVVALVAGTVALVAGTVWFTALAAVRAWEPEEHDRGVFGPLAAPGIRTVVLGAIPLGVTFGALDVALVAFGTARDQPGVAGLLIATMSAGSAAGGIWYGLRTHTSPLHVRYLRLLAVLPCALAFLSLGSSVVALALLAVPAGMAIAPFTAAEAELVARLAPPGGRTEAYTWTMMATVAGAAGGNAAAGALVEASGWRAPLIATAALALVTAVVVAGRRASLAPAQM